LTAELVEVTMNHATSPAATMADNVIKTVTIGGTPPRLLALIDERVKPVFITLSPARRERKKEKICLFTVYGLGTGQMGWGPSVF